MAHLYSLLLTRPGAYQNAGGIDPGPLEVPVELPEAAPLVDRGLLVGEILGVDVSASVEILQALTRSMQLRRETDPDAERFLYDDDLREMRDTFAAIARAVSAAVDVSGRPIGGGGAQLIASEHSSVDELGRVWVGTRKPLLVVELAERLPDLVRLLDTAATHGLFVVMR